MTHKKFHYVYKIRIELVADLIPFINDIVVTWKRQLHVNVNDMTEEYVEKTDYLEYVGLRSCDIAPEKDTEYMGSGSVVGELLFMCDTYGVQYEKQIMRHFGSRTDAKRYEAEVVDFNWLRRTNTLNLVPGGERGLDTSGLACLVNPDTFKCEWVPKHEVIQKRKEGWFNHLDGLMPVVDKKGVRRWVTKTVAKRDGYSHFNKGKEPMQNAQGECVWVDHSEKAQYEKEGWHSMWKGTITMVHPSNGIGKRVPLHEKAQYMQEGWHTASTGRLVMKKGEEKISIFVNEREEYEKIGYTYLQEGTVNVIHLKTGEKRRVPKAEFHEYKKLGYVGHLAYVSLLSKETRGQIDSFIKRIQKHQTILGVDCKKLKKEKPFNLKKVEHHAAYLQKITADYENTVKRLLTFGLITDEESKMCLKELEGRN